MHISELIPQKYVECTSVCLRTSPTTIKLEGVIAYLDDYNSIVTAHNKVMTCYRIFDAKRSSSLHAQDPLFTVIPKDFQDHQFELLRFGKRSVYEMNDEQPLHFFIVKNGKLYMKWANKPLPEL